MRYKKNFTKIINPYLILVLITILSLTPSQKIPIETEFSIPNLDKIVHFIMYFTFIFSVFFKYNENLSENKILKLSILFIITTLYATGLEFIQQCCVAGRAGSFYDFLANELGMISAILLFSQSKIKLN